MADRTNHRLNCLIEKEIRMWDGTVHGATVQNMYEIRLREYLRCNECGL